jgi:hypothetical protein
VKHRHVQVTAAQLSPAVQPTPRVPCVQHLASLLLLDAPEAWPLSPPQLRVQVPETLRRLQTLRFGSYAAWDALHWALWPLVVLAAKGGFSNTGGLAAPQVTLLSPLGTSGALRTARGACCSAASWCDMLYVENQFKRVAPFQLSGAGECTG